MRVYAILAAGLLFGCSGNVDDVPNGAAPTRGTLGGVCYGNDTCNAGLTCVAKACIDTSMDSAVSDSSSGSDVVSTEETSTVPSFERDIIPMLESSCGSKNNECHSRVAYDPRPDNGCRGWLALENAAIGSKTPAGADIGKPTGCPDMPLYDRLTKLDSWECGDPYFPAFAKRKYVEPGKPSTSHLLNKMNGGPQCGVPNVMPKGGKASAADIDLLTRWIQAGAPR
jgi:hypothetical protein